VARDACLGLESVAQGCLATRESAWNGGNYNWTKTARIERTIQRGSLQNECGRHARWLPVHFVL